MLVIGVVGENGPETFARVRAISATIPVTRQALDDAPAIQAALEEWFRRADLATRGFLGLVRCARCHRAARCVYVVAGRLYGRACARVVAT